MVLHDVTGTTAKTALRCGCHFYVRPSMRLCSPFSATIAALISLGAQAVGEETLTLVSSLPRTGSSNAQTTTIVNGIRLAIQEAGGKAGPFTIRYLDWDDASPERGAWDPAVEAANADKAIADPDVMAYIGTYNSGAAKISMPKLNLAGLAMVSPGNTYVGLTKPGLGEKTEPECYRPSGAVTYFRVVPADDLQGSLGAEYAKELGAKKVFILHDRELYGKGLADVFKTTAERIGLQVVGYEGIDPKAANYKALVTKMRTQSPDLVYFGGTTQNNAGQIAKDLVAGGLKAKYLVPDGCREDAFIEAAGASTLAGRAYITFGGVPPEQFSGKALAFLESYKATFQAEPQAYAVYGYEAGRVVIDAIRRAGKKDRAAIVAALRETRDFPGTLGTWSFDANGDTTLTVLSISTVENGKFKPVKVIGQ